MLLSGRSNAWRSKQLLGAQHDLAQDAGLSVRPPGHCSQNALCWQCTMHSPGNREVHAAPQVVANLRLPVAMQVQGPL